MRFRLSVKARGGGGGQPAAGCLDRATGMVDEVRPYSHQRVPRPQQCQVLLGLRAAVVDGAQEPWVYPPEAGQQLGVRAVSLAVALGDEPHLARVGDNDLVPKASKESAHPGGVRPHLENDAARREGVGGGGVVAPVAPPPSFRQTTYSRWSAVNTATTASTHRPMRT